MNYLGKLVVCDRCGKKQFLKLLSKVSITDGTINSNNSYENAVGWHLIPSNMDSTNGLVEVCPKCYSDFKVMLSAYYQNAKQNYESEIETL